MKFGPVPLDEAEGKILGHNIADQAGRRILRKGKPLTAGDVAMLSSLGRKLVYVAELAADDVGENQAAQRIATAIAGKNLAVSESVTGRANLCAKLLGLVRLDENRLQQINMCAAVTLATMPNHAVVYPDDVVATLKIVAYAIPEIEVLEAEMIGCDQSLNGHHGGEALLRVDPLPARRVGLILTGSPAVRDRIESGFTRAVKTRLTTWGSTLDQVSFVSLEDDEGESALAQMIRMQIGAGMEMVILAGETAIMDRHDIAPRAVEAAGGHVTCFGAPVDPGNLLMLARHGKTPVIGMPSCGRSPKRNIVDIVLPRLLAGDYLTRLDIIRLGHGGLLDDVPERPRPRRFA